MVSLTTTELCRCSVTTVTDNVSVEGHGWVPTNFIPGGLNLNLNFLYFFFMCHKMFFFFFPTIEKVKTQTHTHILGSKAIQKQVVGLFGQISVIVCQLSLK